ncbi:hypothetical protein [Metabacillus sp. RGM 3146]|uniref:hypothetical protein n=1 Tax=Metabacillus sp. RGM 3146 TaxID=3401092 RepID=UPI003B990079
MDWKNHFIKDAAIRFRADDEDINAAIADYVYQLSDEEVQQLTRKMDSESLRDAIANTMLEQVNRQFDTY